MGLYLGTYGGPKGGALAYKRDTPVTPQEEVAKLDGKLLSPSRNGKEKAIFLATDHPLWEREGDDDLPNRTVTPQEEVKRIAALDGKGNGNETAIFLATDHPPTREDARRVFGDRLVSSPLLCTVEDLGGAGLQHSSVRLRNLL